MSNCTYVIFNVEELPKINFDQVLQTSAETCRRSVDQTKTLVKWLNHLPPPACVEQLETKSVYYTHTEMLEILNTSEWTDFNGNVAIN